MKSFKMFVVSLIAVAGVICFAACNTDNHTDNPVENPVDNPIVNPIDNPETETLDITVSFDADGGSETAPVTFDALSETFSYPQNPTKDGYTFVCWNYGDRQFSTDGFEFTVNITLKAVWSANDNVIVFHSGDADATGDMTNQAIKTDASANLTANAFAKPNYVFAGWATQQGGSAVYQDGQLFEMNAAAQTDLYAVWTLNAIIVRFHKGTYEDGVTGEMADLIISDLNTDTVLTSNAYSREGYHFAGWSEILYGEAAYADGANYQNSEYVIKLLYAVWEANQNAIVFHINDGRDYILEEARGTGTGVMANQTVESNTTVQLNANQFVLPGYYFDYWNTEPDFSGTYYNDNHATFAVGTESVINLYAGWALAEYEITYDLQGGALAEGVTNPELYNYYTPTFTLNNPTKTDYLFGGWTWDGQTEPQETVEIAKGTTGNLSYAASWGDGKSTVTLVYNNGTADSTIEVTFNQPMSALPDTIYRTGFSFANWNTMESGAGTYYYTSKTCDFQENTTLYAIWNSSCSTLGYSVNGSEVYISTSGNTASLTYVGIPAYYSYYPVTQINAGALASFANMKSLVVSKNVTAVGANAFMNCTNLQRVVFEGTGPLTIGAGAFTNCQYLQAVYLNSSAMVENLTESAIFRNGRAVIVPQSLVEDYRAAYPAYADYISCKEELLDNRWVMRETTVVNGGLSETGWEILADASENTWISIGNSYTIGGVTHDVVSIGERALSGYRYTNINSMPSLLREIKDYAFYGAEAQIVHLPRKLWYMGECAFAGMTKLRSMYFADSDFDSQLVSIGLTAFGGDTALYELYYFDKCPDLTAIGSSAFSGCTALTSVDLSGLVSLTGISNGMFIDCTGLTDIKLPTHSSRTDLAIGDYAFSGCTALQWAIISASYTSIGTQIFRNCLETTCVYVENDSSALTLGDYWNDVNGAAAGGELSVTYNVAYSKLTFHSDSVEATGTMDDLEAMTYMAVDLPSGGFSREGYTFAGWAEYSGGPIVYTDVSEYTFGSAASYDLYAVWEEEI